MADQHTVTVSTENFIHNIHGTDVWHKELKCTCDWSDLKQVFHAEAAAKHHLRYVHGGGLIDYRGDLESVTTTETNQTER